MRSLTIAMPYYRNGGMLRKQMAVWNSYPSKLRKGLTIIIADDGSPDNKAVDNVLPHDYNLQIYEVLVNKPWNQTGARNLAMHHVPDDWCLVTDIDHVLEVEDAFKAVRMPVQSGSFYIPGRRKPDGSWYKHHPNSYYLEKELYWKVGGCNEDFSGVYGSDSTFRRVIEANARREDAKDIFSLTLYGRSEISDASTTEWGRKKSEWHISQHPELYERKKARVLEKGTNPLRFPWKRVL